ncbi:diguanylate cyclase [Demequina sp. SYSU T00192]|uniref:Diguanylate cyclase n=1 Tax=Demequina litoralis TaxID=3051660 RepID=A0ABT8GAQ9_9MICO|nr:diguanylate cyclase [Demequina sp. SYSU T00192]MDN4476225.1 diguanylate cyclase [Demequina sp. SYSU T00192]
MWFGSMRWRMAPSRGVIVAVVIVATVLIGQAATSLLNAVLADRALQAAAADTYTYVGDLMSERVGDFAGSAQDVVEGTASELVRHGGTMDEDALVRALADRLDREPAVGTIFVADTDGNLLALAGADAGYTRLDVTPLAAGGSAVEVVDYDADLTETATETTTVAYTAASRPWYQDALAADGLVWTDPYISVRTDEIVVSPVTAVRVGGEVAAVVGADLDLDLLGALLEDIPIGADARAFILTGDGAIVAAPTARRDELQAILDETDGLPGAEDFGLPTVAPSTLDDEGDAIRTRDDTVSLERTMDPDTGLDWVLHLDASTADLTPSIDEFKRASSWVTVISILMVLVAAAVALRLWRPIRTMRVRAATDALTGLANRYEYNRRLRAILRSAEHTGDAVLLIALDLDNFKQVNDDHGHDAGDVVLAAVGDALLESVRVRDVAARVGGDEFVVVMRLGERGSPIELARRLRDDVATAIHESFAGASGVGATAGFATTGDVGHEPGRLRTAADDALVAGKRVRKGRTYAYGHAAGSASSRDDAPDGPADDASSRPVDDAPAGHGDDEGAGSAGTSRSAGSLPGN